MPTPVAYKLQRYSHGREKSFKIHCPWAVRLFCIGDSDPKSQFSLSNSSLRTYTRPAAMVLMRKSPDCGFHHLGHDVGFKKKSKLTFLSKIMFSRKTTTYLQGNDRKREEANMFGNKSTKVRVTFETVQKSTNLGAHQNPKIFANTTKNASFRITTQRQKR